MTRGIVDPWRVTEPFKTPKKVNITAAPKKINLSEFDWDADLKVPAVFWFRSKHGTIEVRNKQIDSGNDALRDLVNCLFEITEEIDGPELLESARIGIKLGDRQWQEPAAAVAYSLLKTTPDYTPSTVLWFIQQTYDDGMAQLIHLLNKVHKRIGNKGKNILKRWGVMLIIR